MMLIDEDICNNNKIANIFYFVKKKKTEVNNLANEVLKSAAKEAGVCLWEIALAFGLNDGNFSRKLRAELPEEEKAQIIDIIRRIKEEKNEPAARH